MGTKGLELYDEPWGEPIGHGVHFKWTGAYGTDERTGIIISHLHEDGALCAGSVLFDLPITREKFPNAKRWTVEQLEPLTLSPSILDTECGLHGYVREGLWVPA